ncbi:hypothetical protein C8R47DRAFT_1216466 [Mycena vitilis]|nr:hypothetical protein C8R47DRAFT_1216466 [Mycena vitilis]
MAKEGKKTIHSGSQWQEIHRLRAIRRARAEERGLGSRPAASVPTPPEQGAIVTFIPNRAAPVYTTVLSSQGSFSTSYDSQSLKSREPDRTANPPLPAWRPPAQELSTIAQRGHRRRSVAIAERAQAFLRARPTADEILLARLARRSPDPKKKQPKTQMTDHGRVLATICPACPRPEVNLPEEERCVFACLWHKSL